jgi:syntaxin 5
VCLAFAAADLEEEAEPLFAAQQRLVSAELEQKDLSVDYLQGRQEAVEQIESTIQELGQMYQKLATIVSMQNETAIRIDSDMDTALDNVNKGQAELQKLFESVSSNRWLILKVFVTLILFAIFFIIFVA